jgi:hypothetical protein
MLRAVILDAAHGEHRVVAQARAQAFDEPRQRVADGCRLWCEVAKTIGRQLLLEQGARTHSNRDHWRWQYQCCQPFSEQAAQMPDIAARRREPDVQACQGMCTMFAVHGEHRDGDLSLAQEFLQARQQGLAGDLEPCRRLDFVLEGAPHVETLRTAKPAPYVGASAERAIELIEPYLAESPHHAAARQPQQIADGTQSHTEKLRQ